MSEKLRYIVSELNKPPFSKKYNLISFDSLSPEELLQVLSDVLTEIDEANKIDIKNEDPEEITVWLLNMLRVLKYDPGTDPDGFRQGLVQGEKLIIHPILEWLFQNIAELKKRAYLGKYLVKVEIPVEIIGDRDVAVLYEQYEALIEQFKTAHKELTNLKAKSDHAAELRTDIEAMEKEKEIVLAKIHRMEHKLENVENKEKFLEAAHKVRLERERQRELAQQRERELRALQELNEHYNTLTRQISESKESAQNMTAEDVMRKLEEQVQMNEYIANDKLPSEFDILKEEVEMLQRLADGPPLTQGRVEELRDEVEKFQETLASEMEKSVEETSGTDIAPFRHQADLIARKKAEVAQRYTEAKAKLEKLEEELKIKEEAGGGKVVSDSEYSDYLGNLKVRNTVYKAKKAIMSSLKAESGILARTVDILKQKSQSLSVVTEVSSYSDPENKSKDEIIQEINNMNAKITALQTHLIPKLAGVKKKRLEYNELLEIHMESKKQYDAKTASFESKIAKLEQEVKELLKKDTADKSETSTLQAKSDIIAALLERANSEEAFAHAKDKLSHRVTESEKESEKLKEMLKEAKLEHEKNSRQMKHWKNLYEIFQCKMKCLEEMKQKSGVVKKTNVAETLVLE
ncbi:intraflagellar transport protein 81 homolog isoform X1 [Halyomorpha halys]|uniref:intraflagellar transport protein 81 homolog isoform X1 n=1 Tax=Halyomorpha halys TaxID=286706 RepID=UPI0006D4DD22|nr:intraflagellar transport protein 81 homolog isoform X1 [Halyomorpha halys]